MRRWTSGIAWIVGYARELLGGNGILLRAISVVSLPTPKPSISYEGTRENERADRRQIHQLA